MSVRSVTIKVRYQSTDISLAWIWHGGGGDIPINLFFWGNLFSGFENLITFKYNFKAFRSRIKQFKFFNLFSPPQIHFWRKRCHRFHSWPPSWFLGTAHVQQLVGKFFSTAKCIALQSAAVPRNQVGSWLWKCWLPSTDQIAKCQSVVSGPNILTVSRGHSQMVKGDQWSTFNVQWSKWSVFLSSRTTWHWTLTNFNYPFNIHLTTDHLPIETENWPLWPLVTWPFDCTMSCDHLTLNRWPLTDHTGHFINEASLITNGCQMPQWSKCSVYFKMTTLHLTNNGNALITTLHDHFATWHLTVTLKSWPLALTTGF
jgi:hypothetical protein